jgi:4a-hydroxytetrahydrobiopterin dehydratase
MELAKQSCMPYSEGTPALPADRANELVREVPGWALGPQEPRLWREYAFPDFAKAMRFVEKVAKIAEKEGHHPDIHIHYNRVKLVLWTHAIGGLSENDFIVAAKINSLKLARAA